MSNKQEIRKHFLSIRKEMPFNEIEEKSKLITIKVINFIKKYNLKEVCIFLSTKHEVQTEQIINYCLENNINVYAPKIIDDNTMAMCKISNVAIDVRKSNIFNLLEVTSECVLNIENLQTMFIPLVAFDSQMNRIGMGKGFYDKFLSKNSSNYIKIGLAFSNQISNEIIQNDEFDVKLDLIITDTTDFENK